MATEEIRGIPFDSRVQIAEDGTPYEDREVFSADIAKYFGHISSDGICIPRGEALGDDLKVDPSTGGVITINTGAIKIQGRIGWVEEQITRQLDSGGSKPRYDTVVIELNLNAAERRFIAKVIKGEEADEPVPPELTRTSNVYQLGLADIYRVANSTVTGTITDTREDNERCGISSVNAPFGTLGIPDGGTGADNAADARQNLNYIGVNPIASIDDDTPTNWAALGTGHAYISGSGKLNSQPATYGVIENMVVNETVFQTFISHTTGSVGTKWTRTGKTGWDAWVKALDENSGIQIKKLWTNASPSSSFAAQTISVDISDYTHIMMVCNYATTYPKRMLPPAICPNITNYQGMAISKDTYRTFTILSSNQVKLENTGSSVLTDLVPCYIYGIKGVL